MTTNTIKYFLAFILISVIGHAQSDLTLYNFNAIPQSLHTNPAYPQQTKVWVGLPVLSGVHFHFHNSAFTLKDLIPADGPNINDNLRSIANTLDDKSHFALSQDIDLLGIGFKAGRGFVSLGATQSINLRMGYPGDLLKFMSFRSGDPITGFSLNELDYESMVRTNFYLGYQHKFIKNRLTLGFKAKYMFGQQHSFIDRINAQVDASDPFLLRIRTNVLVKTSGLSNYLDDDFDFGSDPVGVVLTDNTGLAWDFGFNFLITRKLSVSGSVLDLGSITWQSGNEDYVSRGEYDFEGIEIDLSQQDFDGVIDNLTDSLQNVFEFDTLVGETYTRALPTRFFAGLNYNLTPKHGFGILYHGRSANGELLSDYSVNYQGRWFRGLQFTASYSVINGTQNNIGAGIDFKFGPLQLYLISDNALGALMFADAQTANIRLGLNITFYGKKDKDPKDMPFFDVPVKDSKDDDSDEEEEESEEDED